MPWQIIDIGDHGRRYITMDYKTEADAAFVRADLLKPYAPDHEWRRRIQVRYVTKSEPAPWKTGTPTKWKRITEVWPVTLEEIGEAMAADVELGGARLARRRVVWA